MTHQAALWDTQVSLEKVIMLDGNYLIELQIGITMQQNVV